MTTGRRLIVNADDFGRTAGINAGVVAAHDRGVVTSATLMVGYPAAAEAARLARRRPGLGVGLHITLTGGGRPIAPADTVTSLVGTDGRSPRDPGGLTGARADDVAREACAQLERFVALVGRLPTHLDSHHHSHRLPAVLAGVVEVARAERLPVRRASPAVAEALAAAGIATTDAFVERFFGDTVDVATLLDIIDRLPPGTTELMCHPAEVDDDLRRSSTYADERAVELASLCDPAVRRALARNGVELVRFGGL